MSKTPVSVFGARLREARRRAGLPQDKVGVEIGLDEGTASARISRYEAGVHEAPYATATRLAEVLNVPVAFFYSEDEELARVILTWGELSPEQRVELNHFLDTLRSVG